MTNPFAEQPRSLAPVADVPEEQEPVVEEAAVDESWPHQRITFMDDVLEVRKPSPQALAAFSLATSKYVSNQMRNDMTGMFISRHLSPDSYERVFSRLMDPDDEEYTVDTIGQLMRAVVMLENEVAE